MHGKGMNFRGKDIFTHQTTSVGESTETTNENIASNGLPENFYSENICNYLLSFLNKLFHNEYKIKLRFIQIKNIREISHRHHKPQLKEQL